MAIQAKYIILVALALLVLLPGKAEAFGAGNIAGSYIFQQKDAPDYIPGKTVVLVTLAAAAGTALVLRALVAKDNRRKKALIEEFKRERGWDDEEVKKQRDAIAFRDFTDKENPFFVYTS